MKNIQRFDEMRYGQWFKECGGENPRIFIKLQNILPSGIPVVYDGFVAKDHLCGIGQTDKKGNSIHFKGTKINSHHYNAIDIDGIPASCPDWLEFELIKCPFKQRIHNHGKNLNLPRR